jgi:hypothetical protein
VIHTSGIKAESMIILLTCYSSHVESKYLFSEFSQPVDIVVVECNLISEVPC